jgi:hypothetical protein
MSRDRQAMHLHDRLDELQEVAQGKAATLRCRTTDRCN